MCIRLGILLFLLNFLLNSSMNTEPVVKLPQGFLKGTNSETRNGRKISIFLGIPYGMPPIGKLRFKSPLAATKWNSLHLAHKEGNICPQLKNNKLIGDENCLYLNVYTPILEFNSTLIDLKNNLLPVMVWIHGGGFRAESSNFAVYGPNYLLDKDVILVSMNYRLGILGFFTTGDSVVPGNMGMKDQVLALKWVQKNIQFFGGDPGRVTIFGQSSAGACVNLHALSDASTGLFHQYIIQSGTGFSGWTYRNRTQFKPHINQLAEYVGCPKINSTILVECLRETSVLKLIKAIFDDPFDFFKLVWTPTDEIEAKDAFLKDSPQNLIKQNKMKDVPFMSGTVVDDGLTTTLNLYRKKSNYKTIKNGLDKYINTTSAFYLTPRNVPKFRKIILDYYFNESVLSCRDKLLKDFTKFSSDSRFIYPQYILVEKMAKVIKSPFYLYSFGYRGIENLISLQYGFKENIGVSHSEELIYLFPFLVPLNNTKKVDQEMINLMVDLWTSFAINGKPTSSSLDTPNFWHPYSSNKSFLEIGDAFNNNVRSVTLKHNYFANRMKFWKRHFLM